ncbi:MAG: DNA polymerase/3'-5' exonuclease PolX [Thermomicrobiales bacterium]|jgi:DNA polymerase (family 10)|nr:DNA polymerase/3'-5' exonuclease PolX [Thermomicrobiales bacterium]
MRFSNAEFAAVFQEVADLLEIDGANSFRVRAYRNAAETINDLGRSLSDMIDAGEDPAALPGIGKDLAKRVEQLATTGTYPDLDRLRSEINPSLRDLLQIPGLGPKKVRKLRDDLGIESLDDLQAAVAAGKLAKLEGFGVKSQEKIAAELETGRTKKSRRKWADAEEITISFENVVSAVGGVERVDVAGSYRRHRETIGDLDILAAAETSAAAIEAFVDHDRVAQVTNEGETRAAVVLRDGMVVDLRVVPPESYGAALLYFTGSKEHNILLRQRAIEREWKLNEYGLYDQNDTVIASREEADIYAALDLPYIEPELRENRGEILAADANELPNLITLGDIRGDIHAHTTWSDGKASIEEMAVRAIELGYEYMAVTDHSPRLAMTFGLDPDKLRRQAEELREVQSRLPEITILHGNEVDILRNGDLDQPDDVLAELDMVIVSVHSFFDLPREVQTARVIAALENPYVRVLGHPQGRILTQREGISLDLEAVFEAARDNNVALEINADPHRLDLDDRSVKFARDIGCKFVINTDAHRPSGYDLMRHGIYQARRGWLESSDVLNTLPIEEFRAALRPRVGR